MDKAELQKYFEDNRYVVVRGFLDATLANLLKEYMSKKARTLEAQYMIDPSLISVEFSGNLPGQDEQVPSSYSWYGDPMMDTLLEQSTQFVGEYIKKNLYPTYSYCRYYITGAELKRHSDRPECQYSTTLCLGGDPWPIFFKDNDGVNIKVDMAPGDMVVYSGCELEHWREPFEGQTCAQVFLHYGDIDDPIGNPLDGRVFTGVPKSVNRETLQNTVSQLQHRSKTLQHILDSTER